MTQGYNPWQDLATAQVFEKGNYLKPGDYKVRIGLILTKNTERSGTGLIVEMTILESNNPSHQIGSKGTWFQGLKDKRPAMTAIKEFMMGVMGCPIEQQAAFDAQYAAQLPSLMLRAEHEHIFRDQTVQVKVHLIRTKERKAIFSVHTWSPFRPDASWQPQPTPAVPVAPQELNDGFVAPMGMPAAPMPYQNGGGYPAPVAPMAPPQVMQGYGAPMPAAAPPPGYGPPAGPPPGYPHQPAYGMPQGAPPGFAPPGQPPGPPMWKPPGT
jgi:hypothetical protein